MKKYDSYKESSAEWLGMIPGHWSQVKLKWISNIYAGGTPSTFIDEYWENGTIPWLNSGSVNQGRIKTASEHISEKAVQNSSTKWVPEGSLLMALAGQGKTKGMVAILEIEATCNQSMAAIVPDKNRINNEYLFYWLQSNYHKIRGLAGNEIRDGLNLVMIGDIYCPLPTIQEQENIANFLNNKIAILDELIEKKQRKIELLKEQHTAVINQAVTKGLNPHVRTKASGVEWIGEIPEHWKIKKIKHIKSKEPNAFVDGPFGSNLKSEHFIENGEVYVVESGFITSGIFEQRRAFKTISLSHYKTISRSTCKGGDIIIAKIGANYGMSGILPELDRLAVVSGNSLKLSIDTKIYNTEFIQHFLNHLKQTGSLEIIVNETAQPALSLGTLNNLSIAVPSKQEQDIISNYISDINKGLTELTKQSVDQIEKLKELRQSLISEVVTGKIDVREWQLNSNNN